MKWDCSRHCFRASYALDMHADLLRIALALVLCTAYGIGVAAEAITVTVYAEPKCTTCSGWIKHLRANGFAVVVREVTDAESVRKKLHVPERHASCHTAEVEGYAIEGHVPAPDIKRLLAEHPDAAGLAVPGMPHGAPGLETGRFEPFDVLLFNHLGAVRLFQSHSP